MPRLLRPFWALLILCAAHATADAQLGTAYRNSLGTALEPATDGTPRYREDTGWSDANFSHSRWVAEYGTTLSASPWIAVLQTPTRTNTSLTAAANKLTLDLAGGTYSIMPYFQSPTVRGGRVTIIDKFANGAYLRVTNGTLNNEFGSNSLTVIGDAGATGRLFVENGKVQVYSMSLGHATASPGFLTLESGGEVVVSNILQIGSFANGTVALTGSDSKLTAARVLVGVNSGTGVVGTITLDSSTALFHASNEFGVGTGDLLINNALPALAGGNAGLVVNAGTALIDRNLELAAGAANRYGSVVINGGRVSVGGKIVFQQGANETSGGKVYLNDGRFEIASSLAFQPSADRVFYWKDGTLAFTDAATTPSSTQLTNFTKQGAVSYGGSRAAGSVASGQTLEAAGGLTLTGGTVGLAGGTIRAGDGLVLDAALSGYGTLDAVVSGGGAISNTTPNDLVIGGLDGANAITSAGNVVVGHRNTAASYSGASSGSGGFTKGGDGVQTVTGSITNAGGVNVAAGRLEFAGTGLRLDTSSVAVADAATLRLTDGATGLADGITIGVSPIAQNARLEVVGAGSALTVANDVFNNGVIELTSSTLNVGGTLVNHGQLINNGTLVAAVDGSGVLSGSGVFAGSAMVANGAVLAPGNSVGNSTFSDLTLGAGGTFELELSDAAGVAGSDWDLATVSGLLSIASTASDPYMIVLKSLDASLAAGLLDGFDASTAWSWQFVAATIANPTAIDPSRFQIDTSHFLNEYGDGRFSVVAANDGLFVSFAPQPASVPEPGSFVLLAGVGLVSWSIRRRRKQTPAIS